MKYFDVEEVKTLIEEKNAEDMKEEKGQISTQEFFDEVVKKTGFPPKVVRRVLLQLQGALYKSDGSNTAFVNKFATKYDLPSYRGLYEFLSDVKEYYRKDREIEAFNMLNELQKSQIGVIGAQINRTFYQNENIGETKKALQSVMAATSFVHRTTGLVMENLKVINGIIDYIEEYKDVLDLYVLEQEYKKGEENEELAATVEENKETAEESKASVKKEEKIPVNEFNSAVEKKRKEIANKVGQDLEKHLFEML